MAKVYLKQPLSNTIGIQEATVKGYTIQEVIDIIEFERPGFKSRVYDKDGELSKFLNVFLNQENVRWLDGVHTPVSDEDEVTFLPGVSGG